MLGKVSSDFNGTPGSTDCRLLMQSACHLCLNSPTRVKHKDLRSHAKNAKRGGSEQRREGQHRRVFFKEHGSGRRKCSHPEKSESACVCGLGNTRQQKPQNEMVTYKNQPPVEDPSTSIRQAARLT